MARIKEIAAREILDSRGNPTINVEIILNTGEEGGASVPSGASTGAHEALELRDQDDKRYGGKGVLKACENVNNIITHYICNRDIKDQRELDERLIDLDGTKNKNKLGANAILGVSLAFARAMANAKHIELFKYIQEISKTEKIELPRPMMNILNGGKHADNRIDIQEFMIIPKVEEFSEKVRIGSEIFHILKEILKEAGYATGVGDEGGFAPDLQSNEQAIEIIIKAIEKAGFIAGKNVNIAIDAAASSFYQDGKYYFESEDKKMSANELIDLYDQWSEKYPIESIEDPLFEDDWEGWHIINERLGDKVQIVGDDLFVTSVERLNRGIEENSANAILIKPNQIGSLTETIDCINKAKKANYQTIISHRSGETCDTFIADLACGTAAGQIKTGSLSRSERVAKYNRLMKIDKLING